MAHRRHTALGNLALWWYGRHRAFPSGQRATRITAAIHRFSEDCVCLILFWFDNHVIGFGHANAEFIGFNRLHRLSIGFNDTHRQTRYAHIENAHGRGVNKAQLDPFARLEQPRPVIRRAVPVDQIGVFRTGDIQQITRAHAHFVPHFTVGHRSLKTLLLYIFKEIHHRALVVIVIAFSHFQVAEHLVRIGICPIG